VPKSAGRNWSETCTTLVAEMQEAVCDERAQDRQQNTTYGTDMAMQNETKSKGEQTRYFIVHYTRRISTDHRGAYLSYRLSELVN
jgi:hypothetical protein